MSEEASGCCPASNKTTKRNATIKASVLWLASLVAAFAIAPGSQFIWLPDFLLLLGFLPLLMIVRHIWPWFVFGILNIVVGFTLQVARFLPETSLPNNMAAVELHLANYHAPIVWIWMGLVCLIYGFIKLIKSLVRLFRKHKSSE